MITALARIFTAAQLDAMYAAGTALPPNPGTGILDAQVYVDDSQSSAVNAAVSRWQGLFPSDGQTLSTSQPGTPTRRPDVPQSSA